MTERRHIDWLVLSILFLATAIVLMLLALIIPAGATCTSLMMMQGCVHEQPSFAQACMTKSEARSAYPGRVLYWHTKNHCWDATPVGQYRRQTREKRDVLPLANPVAVQNIQGAPTFVPWDARIGIPTTKPEGLNK